MITILNGNEKFLIESEIKKIIKDTKVDEMNISNYDGGDKTFDIDELVNDCLTLPFFSERKVVVLKNPSFFKNKKKDDGDEDDINLDSLLKYVKNPVYETELIIYSYDFNFNKSLKIYKEVAKNANVKNINSLNPDDFRKEAYALAKREGLQIDRDALEKLIVNSNNQLWLLLQNIDKLKLYNDKINLKVVEHLTDAYIEDKTYEMTTAIFNRDIDKAIKLYRDFIANDISVFVINATLATNFRMMNELNYYLKNHYSDADIARIMSLQPRRLYYLKKELNNYRNVNFLKMLSWLSLVDQQLKSSSSMDQNERFEILLINLMGEK